MQTKKLRPFLWLCIFRPNYVVAIKQNHFFPNARYTSTESYLIFSSIPEELSKEGRALSPFLAPLEAKNQKLLYNIIFGLFY